VVGCPYPNPTNGSGKVCFGVNAPPGCEVEWTVYTTAFRKIVDRSLTVPGSCTLSWDLKDDWGNKAADGCYYLRVKLGAPVSSAQILKVLVTE